MAEREPAAAATGPFSLEEERSMRLHFAGERDEARSDLRRLQKVVAEILSCYENSGKLSLLQVARWRECAERITAKVTDEPEAT